MRRFVQTVTQSFLSFTQRVSQCFYGLHLIGDDLFAGSGNIFLRGTDKMERSQLDGAFQYV